MYSLEQNETYESIQSDTRSRNLSMYTKLMSCTSGSMSCRSPGIDGRFAARASGHPCMNEGEGLTLSPLTRLDWELCRDRSQALTRLATICASPSATLRADARSTRPRLDRPSSGDPVGRMGLTLRGDLARWNGHRVRGEPRRDTGPLPLMTSAAARPGGRIALLATYRHWSFPSGL
jgi:hypothetical protein